MALLTNIDGKFSVSDAGAVRFNDAFTFPTVDGTANYVLKTNGSGQLSWAPDANTGTVTGSGTANTMPVWTSASALGNSIITQPSSANVRVSGSSVYFSVTDTSAAARNIDIGHWVAGQTNIESVGGILSIGTQSNHDIVFETNGSTKATILANGNVGIGTTSPDTLLHIYNPSTAWGAYSTITLGTDVEGTNQAQLKYYRGASTSTESFQLSVRGTTSLTALYNGNVGIGTTSPAAKLSVVGSGENGGIFFNNSGAQEHRFYSSANSQFNTIGSSSPIWHWAQYTGVGIAPNYKMTLNSTGLGIGTTSPDYILTTQGSGVQRLKVVATDPSQHSAGVYFLVKNGASQVGTGTIATQNNGDMDFYTGSTSEGFRMTILAGGDVGIGTTSPAEKLEVSGSVKIGNLKIQNADGGRIGFNRNTATGAIYNSNYAAFQINGAYSGADYLEIQNYASTGGFLGSIALKNGLVGIGTTNPQTKLEVNGGLVKIVDSGDTAFYGGDYVRVFGTQSYGFRNSAGSSIALISLNGNSYFNGGNVGIGVTGPSEKLHVSGGNVRIDSANNANHLIIQNNATATSGVFEERIKFLGWNNNDQAAIIGMGNAYFGQPVNALAFQVSAVEAMRIIHGGNVGIGDTSPDYRLAVKKVNAATPAIMVSGAHYGGPRIQTYGLDADPNAWMGLGTDMSGLPYEHSIYFSNKVSTGQGALTIGSYDGTNYSTKMIVLNSGNVGIGITSPTYKLHVASSNNVSIFEDTSNASGAAFIVFNRPSVFSMGSITRNGSANSVSYNTGSDYRLKEDLKDFNALDLVNNITAYDYKWKDVEQRDYGFIAHELKQTLPNVVTGEKDGEKMQGVDYSKLTPILLKAIQELEARLKELENK